MDKIEELRKKLISSAKKQVQEKYSSKDVHIIKAVNLLEDLDAASNLLIEQVREWYSFHFPELSEIAKESETYLKLLFEIGERKKFSEQKVSEFVQEKEMVNEIVNASKNSMGSDIDEKDLKEIQMLALNCMNLKQEREFLSKYLEENMKKELPNFGEIAGAIIGAKILAKIGSKKKLAFLPASTIQLIGAEKALFLHFKQGAKSPKYGFLYQHPLVKAAKYHNKGKLARTIAAKLAIAAKADYFSPEKNVAEKMKKQIEKRAEELENMKFDEKELKERKPEQRFEPRERQEHPREFRQDSKPGFGRKPEFGRESRFGRKPSFGERSNFGFRREPRQGFRKDFDSNSMQERRPRFGREKGTEFRRNPGTGFGRRPESEFERKPFERESTFGRTPRPGFGRKSSTEFGRERKSFGQGFDSRKRQEHRPGVQREEGSGFGEKPRGNKFKPAGNKPSTFKEKKFFGKSKFGPKRNKFRN